MSISEMPMAATMPKSTPAMAPSMSQATNRLPTPA